MNISWWLLEDSRSHGKARLPGGFWFEGALWSSWQRTIPAFIDHFFIETSIYRGLTIAMFADRVDFRSSVPVSVELDLRAGPKNITLLRFAAWLGQGRDNLQIPYSVRFYVVPNAKVPATGPTDIFRTLCISHLSDRRATWGVSVKSDSLKAALLCTIDTRRERKTLDREWYFIFCFFLIFFGHMLFTHIYTGDMLFLYIIMGIQYSDIVT